jgi:hypothetical protein
MGFKGHWMAFSKTRIKNRQEKPVALRNAQKPRAARAAFAQALYSASSTVPSVSPGYLLKLKLHPSLLQSQTRKRNTT